MATRSVPPSRVADPGQGLSPWAAQLVARWPAMRAFVVLGAVAIVAGGLIAAVTRPSGFAEGPWFAAYLVLVGGVAQIALGVGQAVLARRPPSPSRTRIEVAAWNLGMVGVIAGALVPAVPATVVGGTATVGALAGFLRGVGETGSVLPVLAARAYRSLALFVLASAPVGIAIAWVRHG